MSSNSDNVLGLIIGAAFVFWMVSPKPDIEEVSVYYKYCPDFQHNSYSCPRDNGVVDMKYKIFVREQRVVSSGLSDIMPCKVYDSENWECRGIKNDLKGNTNVISMIDGKFRDSLNLDEGSLDEDGKHSDLPRYQQISYPEYAVRSVIEFLRDWGILSRK